MLVLFAKNVPQTGKLSQDMLKHKHFVGFGLCLGLTDKNRKIENKTNNIFRLSL